MWTETTRKQYERQSERYASDLIDGEWALITPHLPAAKPIGWPRTTVFREVINALFYLLSTGCQWRLLPKEFPPRSTVHRYFTTWREAGASLVSVGRVRPSWLLIRMSRQICTASPGQLPIAD